MHEINQHPPEVMTAEQRRTEAAALLARGLSACAQQAAESPKCGRKERV